MGESAAQIEGYLLLGTAARFGEWVEECKWIEFFEDHEKDYFILQYHLWDVKCQVQTASSQRHYLLSLRVTQATQKWPCAARFK